MLSTAVIRIHTQPLPAFRTCIRGRCRHLSSEASASLRMSLVTRPPNIIYDYLSPTPSHLLNISLSDFLPESCYPSNFRPGNVNRYSSFDKGSKFEILPQGHHLVYFPPQVPATELLPDGTDLLHSPGEPFVRRMWAGGSLSFNQATEAQLPLDGRCKVSCVERISDVHFKDLGVESDGKVFVDIERRISLLGNPGQETPISGKSDGGPATEPLPSVVETRTLVFMKQKTEATAKEDAAKADRMIRVPQEPGFYISIKPNKSLLFRFSALTFNAHAIHLNPQYARDVEGYRDLLVHGPLTLVLMLSVLRSQLQPGQIIKSLDYRNLAPLYVDEEMRVCTKQRKKSSGSEGSQMHDVAYDVWIERWKGGDRGLAVRGMASIGQCQSS